VGFSPARMVSILPMMQQGPIDDIGRKYGHQMQLPS
jgi:hypothetical protein